MTIIGLVAGTGSLIWISPLLNRAEHDLMSGIY
jgi:hypothetical protein